MFSISIGRFLISCFALMLTYGVLYSIFYLPLRPVLIENESYSVLHQSAVQLHSNRKCLVTTVFFTPASRIKHVVTCKSVWGERILFTLICHKIEHFKLLWPKLTDGGMWLVVMCAPLNYCPNLSATDIRAKNPIWNFDRECQKGSPSLLVYHTKGF